MNHLHDPETEFRDPRRIAVNRKLTLQMKLEILESWKLDLIELQRADDENMRGRNSGSGATAKKLAEVSEVIAVLEREYAREAEGNEVAN